MSMFDEDWLMHYGMPRRSGRYPWGSGEDPFQHEKFYQSVMMLKKEEGLTDKEIQEEFNMTSSEYRSLRQVAFNEHKAAEARMAREYASMVDENGKRLYSNVEIGKMLGRPDTTIGNYLKEGYTVKTNKTQDLIDNIKSQVDDTHYIDVGVGTNYIFGCSEERLKNAVRILNGSDNYELHYIKVPQVGTGMMTTMKVLAPPGTPYEEAVKNQQRIVLPSGGIESYPPDANGIKLNKYALNDPVSISSSRCQVVYAENGGLEKDGLIELRRGVQDIALGNANYMQVRIAVDGTHYIKGMAVYADDLPDGVDVRFNTNKHEGTPMCGSGKDSVFKALKDDEDNQFGALIRQMKYIDSETGEEKQSAINIVNEEGDWGGDENRGVSGWGRKISSQMLSKQNHQLIEKQLDLSYADKAAEYDEIMSVTNPVVKKKLLEAFADECDSSAEHLEASPFPRQSWNVILPVESMAANEVYAPQYKNGETVVLVRFPHGGTFEIPQLKVNNNNKEAESMIGNGIDAIGINAKVAQKLSGADFDGDTVLLIPCNSSSSNVRIKTSPSLEGLKDFDPKERYAHHEGIKVLDESMKGREMGIITNLINDMTIKGANEDEIAAAVRHSMVVIDSVKHKLDYQQSYEDNHIEELKQKYQKRPDGGYGGAATLLSRAKSAVYVPARKEGDYVKDPETGKEVKRYIDPNTGEKLYKETGELKKKPLTEKVKYIDPETGKTKTRKEFVLNEKGRKIYVETKEPVTQESTQMAETKDARTLSTGTLVEELYAGYANKLKGLANEARKSYLATPNLKKDPDAARAYKGEVDALNSKLLIALKNAPRERQAQLLANLEYREKLNRNPNMSKEEQKKIKQQLLKGARDKVGAKKAIFGKGLELTEKEWDAVNKGAVSNELCSNIVNNSDLTMLKKLSMPKTNSASLSSAKQAKIKAMSSSGFSLSEIAEVLGVSPSTVSKYIKG